LQYLVEGPVAPWAAYRSRPAATAPDRRLVAVARELRHRLDRGVALGDLALPAGIERRQMAMADGVSASI
jgi:hypothetical protein